MSVTEAVGTNAAFEPQPPPDAANAAVFLSAVLGPNYIQAGPDGSPPMDMEQQKELAAGLVAVYAEVSHSRHTTETAHLRAFVNGYSSSRIASETGVPRGEILADIARAGNFLRTLNERGHNDGWQLPPGFLSHMFLPAQPAAEAPAPPPRHTNGEAVLDGHQATAFGRIVLPEVTERPKPITFEAGPEEIARLDALTETVEADYLALVTSERFLKAVERKGHDKYGAIFVVGPDDNHEDNVVLEAIQKKLELEFLKKDGEENTGGDDKPGHDWYYGHVVYNRDGTVKLLTAAHTREQTAEDDASEESLLCLDDIAAIYQQDPEKILAAGGYPPPRRRRNFLEVMSIAVDEEDQNQPGAFYVYNAILRTAAVLGDQLPDENGDIPGIDYLVQTLDEPAAIQLNKLFGERFRPVAPEEVIPHINYRAARPGANSSIPRICDVKEWQAELLRLDDDGKRIYGKKYEFFFGRILDGRVHFPAFYPRWLPTPHGLDNALSIESLVSMPDQDDQPYLFMDLGVVEQKYQALAEAFAGQPFTQHYAVKCNDDPMVLQKIIDLGGKFEVASIGELLKLVALHVDPADVLYSNPIKSPQEIYLALKAGMTRMSAGSISEIEKIAAAQQQANIDRWIAGQPEIQAQVYVRLSTQPAVSGVPSEGKFGVDSDTAVAMINLAHAKGLDTYGLTFHVGSQMETVAPYGDAIRLAADVIRRLYEQETPVFIRMLDVSGGFPAAHNFGIPPITDYATEIISALEGANLPYPIEELIGEPGRYLVAEAGTMVATVIGTSVRPDGTHMLHVNVGAFNGVMEALETSVGTNKRMRYPMADSRRQRGKLQRVWTVTGPTCDSQDEIGLAQLSADLQVGDKIAIGNLGAYSTVYSARDFNGFGRPYVRTSRLGRVLLQ